MTLTSSFDFCFTLTTSDEKTQGNSVDLDMVLLTRKQLPVVLKLDLHSFFSFFWAVRAQMTVTRLIVRASFEVNSCPILTTKV